MNKDRIGSFFLFAFGLVIAVSSVGLSIGTIKEPGAGLFPLIIAISLCVVSLISWFKPVHNVQVEWKGSLKRVNTKPLKIIFISTLFVIGMEPVGYLTMALLYLFCLFSWVCQYKPGKSLLLTCIIAPLSWLFFVKALSLLLPVGPFGF